jgi:hypothetical protein
METEIRAKIAKYEAKLAMASDVDKSQLQRLIADLKALLPAPVLKVHTTPEVCESCQ